MYGVSGVRLGNILPATPAKGGVWVCVNDLPVTWAVWNWGVWNWGVIGGVAHIAGGALLCARCPWHDLGCAATPGGERLGGGWGWPQVAGGEFIWGWHFPLGQAGCSPSPTLSGVFSVQGKDGV
jgi:hypothetical protein